MSGDWVTGVIDELARRKRSGMCFDDAWTVSYRKCRPSRRDATGVESENLFEMARAYEEEPLPAFVKRVCADAWHNRRPELAHLGDMRLDGDLSPLGERFGYQAAAVGKYRSAA